MTATSITVCNLSAGMEIQEGLRTIRMGAYLAFNEERAGLLEHEVLIFLDIQNDAHSPRLK